MSTPQTHAPPKPPPPREIDPAEIIRLALADETTRGNLIAQIRSKLSGKQLQDCEDVLGNLTRRALEKGTTYDPAKSEPGAWLHGVLVNILHEYFRNQGKLPKTGHEWGLHKDVRVDSEQEFDYADTRFRLQRYYDKLPKEYQAAVKMKYFEDLDGLTAAKRLAISYDSYRVRLSRAMKMLRELAGADSKGGRS